MDRLDDERMRKVRVVWHYYVEGLTQDAIGRLLGVTRIRVQRMLAQAREEGLVRVTITDPLAITIEMAEQLKRRFGLRDVMVAPRPHDGEQVRTFLGYLAARQLDGLLRDGMSLGVGWGTTLVEATRALSPRPLQDFSVVTLMGGLTRSAMTNPHEIAWRLAQIHEGGCYYLAAPTYADSVTARETIVSQPTIGEVLGRARRVDVALLSVGTLHNDATMRRSGLISDADACALEQRGAVGDILGWQIDRSGRLVDAPLNERVIALPLEALRDVPTVILVSGGLQKVPSILGAIRGGLVDILITDEDAAGVLLREEL